VVDDKKIFALAGEETANKKRTKVKKTQMEGQK